MAMVGSGAVAVVGILVLVGFSARHHRAVVVGTMVGRALKETLRTFNHCGPRIFVREETENGNHRRRFKYFLVNPNYPDTSNLEVNPRDAMRAPAMRWIAATTLLRLNDNPRSLPVKLDRLNIVVFGPYLSATVSVRYPQLFWGQASEQVSAGLTATQYREAGPRTLRDCYAAPVS